MERIFVDTGAWFAFFNKADPDHEGVAEILFDWEGRLLTSDYVFDELVTLLRYRVSHGAARKAGEALLDDKIVLLVAVDQSDLDQAWVQFVREGDKRYSFTDCTSFAVMRRLDVSTAAAVDMDFRRAGFRVLPQECS